MEMIQNPKQTQAPRMHGRKRILKKSQMGPQERFRVRELVVGNFNVQIERAF